MSAELLAPLDGWLRDVFLPQLPENVLTVLASRYPLTPAWRADPGWQFFVRALALRNLTPDEGRYYLAQRHVPAEELQKVLDFTHSYPLALSLVADLYDQRPGFRFTPAEAPDVIKPLLELTSPTKGGRCLPAQGVVDVSLRRAGWPARCLIQHQQILEGVSCQRLVA